VKICSVIAAVILGLFVCGRASFAQSIPLPQATATIEMQTNTSYQWLDNGLGNWSSYDLMFIHKDSDLRSIYVDVLQNEEFYKQDQQILAGYATPLSPRFNATVELTTSTGLVLPRNSELMQLDYGSGSAWYEKFGVSHTTYSSASVNSGMFTLEHYWKSFRISSEITAASLAGTGVDTSYALGFDHYYGKAGNNTIGIRLNAGREIENIGEPQLLVSQVSGWSIVGRHWFSPRWAASYQIGTYIQGTSYTRKGISLGLDRRF